MMAKKISKAVAKPWLAEGVCRATWFNRERAARGDHVTAPIAEEAHAAEEVPQQAGDVSLSPPLSPLEVLLEIARDHRMGGMTRVMAARAADQLMSHDVSRPGKASRAQEAAEAIGREEDTGDWGNDLQSRVVKRLVDYRQQ
jgi:hypothetical protein